MDTPDTYNHLFWGYAAIWFCIAAFVLATQSAQRKQLRRLDALEKEYERAGIARPPVRSGALANDTSGS